MARDYRGREDDCVTDIVEGDMEDIDRCTLLIALAKTPSWGTAMEIHYAAQKGLEVWAICDGRVSPWLRYHAARIFRSVADAVAAHELHFASRSQQGATLDCIDVTK